MSSLIIDYICRWWGMLVPVAVAVIFWRNGENKVTLPFLAPWLFSPLLLLSDLRRGHLRVLLTQPLTARQIGRAWWTASVGLPGAALLLAGGLLELTGGGHGTFILNAFLQVAWLGFVFLMVSLFSAQIAPLATFLFAVFLLVSLTVRFINYHALGPKDYGLILIFLSAGAVATLLGWLNAGALVRDHLRSRSDLKPAAPKYFRAPTGVGGLRFLFRCSFEKLAFWLIMCFALLLTSPEFLLAFNSLLPLLSFYLVFHFWVLPVLLLLRLLQSLPVSPARLSFLLMGVPVLSYAALYGLSGFLLFGVGGFRHHDLLALITCSALLAMATLSLSIFLALHFGLWGGLFSLLACALLVLPGTFLLGWLYESPDWHSLRLEIVLPLLTVTGLWSNVYRLLRQRGLSWIHPFWTGRETLPVWLLPWS